MFFSKEARTPAAPVTAPSASSLSSSSGTPEAEKKKGPPPIPTKQLSSSSLNTSTPRTGIALPPKAGPTSPSTPPSVAPKPKIPGKGVTFVEEPKSDSKSGEPSFFSSLVQGAKSVLLETKKLRELATAKDAGAGTGTEDKVLEGAKAAAASTIELLKIVENYIPASKKMNVREACVWECCKKVRTQVVAFIEAAKSVLNNPLDFMARQQLDSLGYISLFHLCLFIQCPYTLMIFFHCYLRNLYLLAS